MPDSEEGSRVQEGIRQIRAEIPGLSLPDGIRQLVIVPGKEGSRRGGPFVEDELYDQLKKFAEAQGWKMEHLWLEGAVALINERLKTAEQVADGAQAALSEAEQQLERWRFGAHEFISGEAKLLEQREQALTRDRQAFEELGNRRTEDLDRREAAIAEQERILNLRRDAVANLEEAVRVREAHLHQVTQEMTATAQVHAEKALLARERDLAGLQQAVAVREGRAEERMLMLDKREQQVGRQEEWLEVLEGRVRRIAGEPSGKN